MMGAAGPMMQDGAVPDLCVHIGRASNAMRGRVRSIGPQKWGFV
ncbi:hypothetical protein KKY_2030 [Pelagibacterium halotolerans B2]|uniref:Uncharacterized protein n=1 Tax=Pelagibacterium halotolerans (strain DSM 22347 / JCM 15775 / CGMCC 1.7692 / B2) TaxID=1082931 RepID=G4RG26_PELHB|nr:hypothetical protein KKY_2030 [Pelagibacterium halotolerans B2]